MRARKASRSFGFKQSVDHADRPRRIEHVDGRLVVSRRDFHGRVFGAGRGAADQQRQIEAFALEFAGDVDHFVEAGSDQAAQADQIDPFALGGFQNSFAGDHHSQVDDLVIVAAQHHADDVLADVVNVSLDGGHQDFAADFRRSALRLSRLRDREADGRPLVSSPARF